MFFEIFCGFFCLNVTREQKSLATPALERCFPLFSTLTVFFGV
jgi:hypothetical protein